MGAVCYQIIKFLVVIVNFLFLLIGLLTAGLAIWMLIDPTFYIAVDHTNNYYISTYILLAAGVLLVIVAFLGCCGAFQESQCMLISFFCILLIVLVAQIATAVWAYVNADTLEPLMRSSIKMAVQEDYVDTSNGGFGAIQKGLQCCGAERPTDWIRNSKVQMSITDQSTHYTIPQTCCRIGVSEEICIEATKFIKVGQDLNTQVIYAEGCIDKVFQVLKTYLCYIIGVAIAVIVCEVIGMLFALILMIAIKRSERYKA